MSVALGHYHGERAVGYGDDMALTRVTDNEMRRNRAIEMYLAKRAGIPVPRIARKFRITREYAYQEIKSLPPDLRERLDEFGLQGLRAS